MRSRLSQANAGGWPAARMSSRSGSFLPIAPCYESTREAGSASHLRGTTAPSWWYSLILYWILRALIWRIAAARRAAPHRLQRAQDRLPLQLRHGAARDRDAARRRRRAGDGHARPAQGREVGRRQDRLVRQHHRPLQRVLQLAHVARPAVLQQQRERLVG